MGGLLNSTTSLHFWKLFFFFCILLKKFLFYWSTYLVTLFYKLVNLDFCAFLVPSLKYEFWKMIIDYLPPQPCVLNLNNACYGYICMHER